MTKATTETEASSAKVSTAQSLPDGIDLVDFLNQANLHKRE